MISRAQKSSPIAQTFPPIPIQVHQDQPAPAAGVKLMIASAQSALEHRLQTPRTSNVPVDTLLAASPRSTSTPSQSTLEGGLPPLPTSFPRPGTRGYPLEPPTTPAGTNLFGNAVAVYSPPLHRSYHSQQAPPTALTSALFPSPLSVKPKWDEITSWNLLS